MIDFKTYLQQERAVSVAALDKYLAQVVSEYQDLDTFIARLMQEIREYNRLGGKMHRPLLTRLAYAVVGGKPNASLAKVSVSMELLHRYILAHDDILDQDLYRHGAPTIQKQYTEQFRRWYPNKQDQTYSMGMQMVGGDIMHSLVYRCVADSEFESEIKLRVIEGIVKDMIETSAGWLLETNLKQITLAQVNEVQIKKAMNLVSSQYSILWPLRVGQLLAGKQNYETALENYGKYVGWAFQLQDDLLGMFGQTEITGKPVGSDHQEGKKTLFLLEAYKRAGKPEKDFLENTLGHKLSKTEINKVQAVIKQTGAYDDAIKLAKTYAKQGIMAIKNLDEKNGGEAVEKLEALAKYLAERDF